MMFGNRFHSLNKSIPMPKTHPSSVEPSHDVQVKQIEARDWCHEGVGAGIPAVTIVTDDSVESNSGVDIPHILTQIHVETNQWSSH